MFTHVLSLDPHIHICWNGLSTCILSQLWIQKSYSDVKIFLKHHPEPKPFPNLNNYMYLLHLLKTFLWQFARFLMILFGNYFCCLEVTSRFQVVSFWRGRTTSCILNFCTTLPCPLQRVGNSIATFQLNSRKKLLILMTFLWGIFRTPTFDYT